MTTRRVLLGATLWLGAALLFGASGVLAAVPPPFPQVVLLGVTGALLGAVGAIPAFRAWALTVDVRGLVLFHVVRFVGFYFLVLHGRGELPWEFAVPGGWGDNLVAVAALGVAAVPPQGPGGWGAYFIWNTVGLLDILLVVASAARLALGVPGSMQALTRLPLSLLLTFVVPIIIATHVVIFRRLWVSRARNYQTV